MKIFCSDCKHVKICKHFEYLMRNPELTLGGCRMFESFLKEQVEQHEPPTIHADGRDIMKLLRFDKKEQQKEAYPEPKICNECGGKTYGDLVKCNECGIEICSTCAFFDELDIESLEADGCWCQHCYEQLFHEELEVEDDVVVSLYEVLTSSLQEGDE